MNIDYDMYHDDILRLADLINLRPFNRIYGIHKGGLIVACHVAYILDNNVRVLPLYKGVDDNYYMHNNKHGKLTYMSDNKLTKNDIIIDDIYDTGKTYKDAKANFPEATFAFLYAKKDVPDNKTNICAAMIRTMDYIVLPYQT